MMKIIFFINNRLAGRMRMGRRTEGRRNSNYDCNAED